MNGKERPFRPSHQVLRERTTRLKFDILSGDELNKIRLEGLRVSVMRTSRRIAASLFHNCK